MNFGEIRARVATAADFILGLVLEGRNLPAVFYGPVGRPYFGEDEAAGAQAWPGRTNTYDQFGRLEQPDRPLLGQNVATAAALTLAEVRSFLLGFSLPRQPTPEHLRQFFRLTRAISVVLAEVGDLSQPAYLEVVRNWFRLFRPNLVTRIVDFGTLAIVTIAGDARGPSNANTVAAVQGNPWAPVRLALADAGKVATWDGAQWTASAFSVLAARARTELFVGVCNPPLPSGSQTGSAVAPFSTPQAALAWVAADAADRFIVHVAPDDYSAAGSLTIPTGKALTFSSQAAGAVQLGAVSIQGSGDANHAIVFDGAFSLASVDFVGTGQATLIALKSATLGAITNSAAIGVQLIGAGVLATDSASSLVRFTSTINLGAPGHVDLFACDVTAAVTAFDYHSVDCKNPTALNLAGTEARILCPAKRPAFPHGACTVTFTGDPGTLFYDLSTALAFATSSSAIVHGEPDSTSGGPRLARCDTAFTALQAAKPSAAGHFTLATGGAELDGELTAAVVYPAQPTIGAIGLFWPIGQVPTALALGSYYRDSTGSAVPYASLGATAFSQRLGVSDGATFSVNIGEEFQK